MTLDRSNYPVYNYRNSIHFFELEDRLNTTLFEYRDYKKYVLDLIEKSSDGGRGLRKKIAAFVGCQVSHITNVLTGSAHFSFEQGEAVARYFGLDANETEFFLLLIQYNRAGTINLKKHCLRILETHAKAFLELGSRIRVSESLRMEDQARYYSCWQMGAAHMLLSIPAFQTRDALAKKLGVSLARIDEILSALVDIGICKKEGLRFKLLAGSLHLDRHSPFIAQHHTNWRMCAARSLDFMKESDLHYSSAVSLSKSDIAKVREILTRALSESIDVIKASGEEELGVICIDFFTV